MKKSKESKKKSIPKKLEELLEFSKIISDFSLKEAAVTDSSNSFPEDTLKKIKNSELLLAATSEKFGGCNLGLKSGTHTFLLKILKNIGSGNLVMGRVLEGHINAQLLIHQFGDEKQQSNFAKDAADGKLFGVWNTEANDGTFLSPQHEKGKNTKNQPKNFILKGSKTFATGVGFVTRPLVTAAMPDGSWQMCVVPLDEVSSLTDASWWNPLGMKSSRSFKINFLQAAIGKKNLIGLGGDYYKQPAFGGGAIRFAAVQLGAAERLLDETRKYLKELNRLHDPFQNTRIGEMAIAVESGNQWITAAAKMLDTTQNDSDDFRKEQLVIFANMMRTATEQICTLVINHCMKCVGARGLNKPYHFERIIRDLNTYLRQPAPDAVLADIGNFALKTDKMSQEMWT